MHGQQWLTRTPSSIGDSYTIATAGVASAAISSDRCRCCNRGDNITVSGAAPRPPRARADLRPPRRGSPTRPDDLHATLLRLERFSRRISPHGRIHRLCRRDVSRIARARTDTKIGGGSVGSGMWSKVEDQLQKRQSGGGGGVCSRTRAAERQAQKRNDPAAEDEHTNHQHN